MTRSSRRDFVRRVAAAAVPPLLAWPGCAGPAGLPAPAPAEPQSDRARRLLDLALAGGDAVYSEKAGLCVDAELALDPHAAAKYRGSWVAWYSPNYAYALLAAGRPPERAERILGRILDAQQTDPAKPHFGNFRAIAEWDAVRDTNAAVFVVHELGPLCLDFAPRLGPDLQQRLRAAFDRAATAITGRRVDWFYTNIFLLTIACECLLARLLERPELGVPAGLAWRVWTARTIEQHVAESNSPSYFFHHIAPLLTIRQWAPDPAVRAQAEAAARHLLLLLAANYHPPSSMLAGTACRAYLENCRLGRGGFHLLMHQFFGTPLALRTETPQEKAEFLEATGILRHALEPSPEATRLARAKTYPCTVTARYASGFGKDQGPWDPPSVTTCTNYQTGAYSLSTQYGVWTHYGQEVPLLITRKARASPGGRPPSAPAEDHTVYLRGGPGYSMIDAYFRQDGPRALGATYWERPDEARLKQWWKDGPPYRLEHRLYVGGMIAGDEHRGGSPPPTEPAKPPDDFVFALGSREGVRIGLRALPPPTGVTRPEIAIELDRGAFCLVVTYAHALTAERFLAGGPVLWGLYVVVEEGADDAEALMDMERRLRHMNIASRAEDGWWTLEAEGLKTVIPLTTENRLALAHRNAPPIREALLECPGVRIDGAELARRLMR